MDSSLKYTEEGKREIELKVLGWELVTSYQIGIYHSFFCFFSTEDNTIPAEGQSISFDFYTQGSSGDHFTGRALIEQIKQIYWQGKTIGIICGQMLNVDGIKGKPKASVAQSEEPLICNQ